MIVSASRRTDIPAYYYDWLMNRLRAGYALSPNPMNAKQVRRIRLDAESVDCLVLWTKDIQPMLSRFDELDRMGYRYYVQHTLTPYDRTIERFQRDKRAVEASMAELSARIGAGGVCWRYDPILIRGEVDVAYHIEQFTRMADRLHGRVRGVTISFLDLYLKLDKRAWRAVAPDERAALAEAFGRVAGERGLKIDTCCEGGEWSAFGIGQARCIDPAIVSERTGRACRADRDRNQRPGCGCAASVDIGMYDSCPGGCGYCYANRSQALVARNRALHRPEGEMLIGAPVAGAVIREKSSRMTAKPV